MLGETAELDRMEEKILGVKAELSSISRERRLAALAGKTNDLMEARMRALQKTLENCGLLVEYVRKFSDPISREIEIKHEMLRKEFEHMREVHSPDAFHEWVRGNVVPVLKQSEQAAHLAATIIRKSRGEKIAFHRWTKRLE
jgi:predicted RNase H-like nuclease (RuvC/YqgF family)